MSPETTEMPRFAGQKKLLPHAIIEMEKWGCGIIENH
jgi:hypothetical protein